MDPAPSWTPLPGAARDVVLEVLLRGPLSRSELARRLHLSPGSLTRLTRPLLDSGLLVESDTPQEARSGRPSRPLDIAPRSHHFVGVKVTGEEAHAVLTDLRAGVLAVRSARLPGSEPADVVAAVRELAAALTAPASLPDPRVTALGVGLGGRVADRTTVTRAPFLGWERDVPLGALLQEATGWPTVVDNDLLALTRATHWFGAARGCDRFAVLTVGAGVGYGLVVHGTVVESPDAGLGLVGHLPLDPLGPLCPQGHRGCAGMLTVPAIRTAVSVALRREVSYDECLDLAEAGDPAARRVVHDAGRALGRMIAIVGNLTMPQRIVLTGEGVRLAEVARTQLHEAVRAGREREAAPLDVDVRPLGFTDWARGAAVTAIQECVLRGARRGV